MKIAIITALITAATAIIGWFVTAYLSRRKEDRAREIEKKGASKDLIREVLSACYTRAVYTRTHAQLDHNAMFRSLASCRSHLQKVVTRIEPKDNQQLVADIISQLDFIERNKEDFNKINQAKLRIIGSLAKLSDEVGVSYVLPHSTTEDVFFSIEEANMPPTGPESPANDT